MEQIFDQYPWMGLLGPLIGAIVLWLKEEEMLSGWKLLWASCGACFGVICAYGLAQGWTIVEWRHVPFVGIVVIATSSLTASTLEHAADMHAQKVLLKPPE